MILRLENEGCAYILYGIEVLQKRPQQASEENHENLESQFVGGLTDADSVSADVEEALYLPYDELLQLGIRHHDNDKT